MPFYRQINWQSGEVTCLSSHGHLEVNVGAKLEFIHTMSCSGVKYHSRVREEASNVCKQICRTLQEPEYFGHNLLDVRHFFPSNGISTADVQRWKEAQGSLRNSPDQ